MRKQAKPDPKPQKIQYWMKQLKMKHLRKKRQEVFRVKERFGALVDHPISDDCLHRRGTEEGTNDE